jgi:S-layer protein
MATISAEARQSLIALYVGMFQAAPGGNNLSSMVNMYESGSTLKDIAVTLKGADFQTIFPDFMTAQEFADTLVSNMLGTEVTGTQISWSTNWVLGKLNAGVSTTDIIVQAVNALRATPNPAYTNAQMSLANKVAVAEYYSVNKALSSTNLATLQEVVAGVTSDAATITTAEAAVDEAANIASGQTFTLTTGIDSVNGGSGNDIINAPVIGAADTFSSLDSINGGSGTDTLNIVTTGSLAGAAGATVTGVENVTLTSSSPITAANLATWSDVQTLKVVTSGAISGVTASGNTDINIDNALAGVSVNGGKNVTVNNSTAGNVSVGATVAASGDVSATNSFVTGTVAIKGAGNLTGKAAQGAITFTNGSTVTAEATKAVAAATRAADTTAQTNANTANTKATGDTDASGLAKTAAATKVTTLSTLQTDIAAATNSSADVTTALSIQKATWTAYQAKAISLADMTAINSAFITGLATSAATGQTAAQAVLTPLQTAATSASAAAVSADAANDAQAAAALAAANAVVALDTAHGTNVAGVNVTATTNTALSSATIMGNYGATNTVTDGSTLGNTLTSVTLNNAGATTITGSAVANVSMTGMTSTNVTVSNSTAAHMLTVTVDNSSGTYTDATAGTVNINNTAAGVTGNAVVMTAGLATAVNINAAAGLNLTGSAFAAAAVIDGTASTAGITYTVGAGQTFTGGSGNDTITTNGGAAQTKAVDGGGGNDTLVLANAADFAGAAAAKYMNFDTLKLGNGITAAATAFTGSTITGINLNAGGAGNTAVITGLNATSAGNITISSSGTYTIGVTGATTVGQLDTASLTGSVFGGFTLTAPTLAGVETINLNTGLFGATVTALTNATAFTNINLTGGGTTSVTSGALALNVNSVVNASGHTGNVTLDFSAGLANGISLIGGSGNDVLTGTNIAGKGNSISSGNGNNTITGGQADDIISVGSGNNTINGGSGGNDSVTAGDGNNGITTAGGTDTITAGNGWNTIVSGAGADTITLGTGGNLVTAGAGADKITFGAHAAGVIDGLVYTAASETLDVANAAALASAAATSLAGVDVITGLQANDKIDLSGFDATISGAFATTSIAAATGATGGLVTGDYNALTGVFTAAAAGADSLVVWDADGSGAGTAVEAVVLVGYHGGAAMAAGGVITLG